jgi:hypothetical protein
MPTFGSASKTDSLEIRWPDGSRESRRDVSGGARLVIEQSRPTPTPNPR